MHDKGKFDGERGRIFITLTSADLVALSNVAGSCCFDERDAPAAPRRGYVSGAPARVHL